MTTDRVIARCSIYANRPPVCHAYPKVDQHILEECTYNFVGNERRGQCGCDVGACCATPRMNGEPGGVTVPEGAGGLPCKYLEWVKAPELEEKKAETLVENASGQASSTDYYNLVSGSDDT